MLCADKKHDFLRSFFLIIMFRRIDDFDRWDADDQILNFGVTSEGLDYIVGALRYAQSYVRQPFWSSVA